jgi:hypothetical protein
MVFKKFISIAAVVLSLIAVVATSQRQYYMDRGDFDVKSDCTVPIIETVITVQNYQVIAPGGLSYLNLGFPTSIVTPGQDSVGVSGGVTRSCRNTYANEVDGDWVFTCFDNGNLACTIYLRQR